MKMHKCNGVFRTKLGVNVVMMDECYKKRCLDAFSWVECYADGGAISKNPSTRGSAAI